MTSTPVQPHQRIHYLDVVRGFAITGVLIAYVFWNLGNAPESSYRVFDNILNGVTSFLIDSKCYTLLAGLFTVGFVLHMNKADDRAGSLHTYRRRLLGLLIIGLLHAILLRNGDILVPYALLTFLVSFFYSSSNRTIIIFMMIAFSLQILVPEAWKVLHLAFPQRPETGNKNYWADNFDYVKYWYATAIFFWEGTLFLLFGGLLLGKLFIENKKQLSKKQLRKIAVIGFLASAASYYILHFYGKELYSLADIGNTQIVRSTLGNLLWLVHGVGLASTYACVFFLLSKRFSFDILANLGRMSLTNYVLQAIIVVPLCLLLDLFDRMTPSIALIMAVSIWIVQVLISTWWLKYNRFGPLEWTLRRFTYGNTLNQKKIKEDVEEPAATAEVL